MVSLVCAFAFGALGLMVGRSMHVGRVFVVASCGAVAAFGAWQLLFWRAVRGALVPLHAVRSELAKSVETADFGRIHIEDGKVTAELTALINLLMDAARDARQSSAELEFANRVLLRERGRVRSTLNSVGEGILAVASDQRVIFANRAAEPFLSVPATEATGKAVHECVSDAGLLHFLAEPESNTTGAADRMEISFDDQPSSSVFSVAANTIADENEQVVGKCVVFHDVTNFKRAESAREEFVDSVAHELRTPLTSIKAYVEMLIDGEAADREAEREFYNIIYEETDRLNRLIDNLLNISKMEVGTVVVNRTPTRLKKLIEDSVGVVESQATKKQLKLEIDLPDRLPAVEVDKDMMNIVLVNLLGNAVKYTPESGQISVSSSSTPDEIMVHVADTGVGVAEEDLSRIFDKFYRCSGNGGDAVAGSGLGLYITRQIMRLHGGDVTVSSRVGEGTRFSLVIPRSAVVTSLGDYDHDRPEDSGN
jgi:two-component system phosphate regulon sensor histidine kinase PhoR